MSNADLIERLMNTPNWMRESFGDWKGCVSAYDRAPFEAADALAAAYKRIAELEGANHGLYEGTMRQATRIAELERKLAVARQALESCGVNHGLNGPQQHYDESLVDTALAQIGGES